MSIAIVTHHDCLLHDMAPGHPERPERLLAIDRHLVHRGYQYELSFHDAPLASREQLERVHDAAFVRALFEQAPREGVLALDPDTKMTPFTLNAARRAAGAVVEAVELLREGEAVRCFCSVRPPGHHATRRRAMGFCFFNNVAVGAAHALARGWSRVAICDFDVHHGNGTEDIFGGDPRVLLLSSFQHPFYPHTGAESVHDNVVATPLPAGSDGATFRAAVERDWLPRLEAFRPELVFVSAGFDAHRDDPLGGLELLEDDYRWVTRRLLEVARRHADGRIVSTLEGGYDLEALGASVCAHIDALID